MTDLEDNVPTLNQNCAVCENSPSSSANDDESVFTEENGIRRYIRPGELVRACGVFETFAVKASKYRNYNTVMPVWLQAKKPISPEDVSEALWIVSRQVPHLQFCFSKRKGQFWFKRMKELKIDFEITSKNEIDVLHELLDTSFNLWNGPLWKVRLTNPSDGDHGSLSYVVVFAIFHSINDGVTNMKIAREFVSVMNKLATRSAIVPTFSPVVYPVDSIARSYAPMPFLIKKVARGLYSKLFKNFHHETSFSGRLPFPETKIAATRVLIDNLTERETELIGKMCKQSKISINTFVITVTNVTLMMVAKGKSAKQLGTRKIVVVQSVNVRRDFEAKYSDAPGYHSSLTEDKCRVAVSDADDFWTMAMKDHLKFKDSLEIQKKYLKIIPIYHMTGTIFPINKFLTSKGMKNKTLAHYSTSNMGNLKNFLPEPNEKDDIKITYLIRAVSLQLAGSLFMLNFQSLYGKMIFSLDYYTNQMTDETAQEIFTVFFRVIRNLIDRHESDS